MVATTKIWCDEDNHKLYEHFVDFNDWLDSDDGLDLRGEYKVDGISQPSKAFYAGDREAYEQAFQGYREERRREFLNELYLCAQFTDEHWFERNLTRFDQLIARMEEGAVVPFIGAGLSTAGGFPTWEKHLYQQGRTAGVNQKHIEALLRNGGHEAIIEEIEKKGRRDVFIQEIRDVFSKIGEITNATLLITELFRDTVITTNYDRLIEQAFDTGEKNTFQIIPGVNALQKRDVNRISIIKLHGDIKNPTTCVLSRGQYDDAYGNDKADMTLPIPKALEYYYKNSSLLFLGCSLNNDRTIQVFKAIKQKIENENVLIPQHFTIEQAPESEEELSDRNADLLKLGITAIWFEKGKFECVENILMLARNELRYKGILPFKKNTLKTEGKDTDKVGLILIIERFLSQIKNKIFTKPH